MLSGTTELLVIGVISSYTIKLRQNNMRAESESRQTSSLIMKSNA